MKTYQTRSERHQKQQESRGISFQPKTLVPLMGIGLIAAPVGLAAIPNTAEATEYSGVSEQNISSFIEQMGWSAQQVADSNDLYASVMIAQALLESGYGTSHLSSAPYYNLFGVKGSYNGQSVYMPTKEYLNGQWVEMNEPFRQYGSYWESFQDHANVLKSTSFSTGTSHYSGAWKSQTASFYDATSYLTGRYATDPTYGQKLNWLIENYQLTRFDTPTASTASYSSTESATYETSYSSTESTTSTTSSQTYTVSSSESATNTTASQTYTVASGDSLWEIASTYGTTIDQIIANNGLSGDLIVVGQELIV